MKVTIQKKKIKNFFIASYMWILGEIMIIIISNPTSCPETQIILVTWFWVVTDSMLFPVKVPIFQVAK